MPFPNIDVAVQNEIRECIQKYFELCYQSEQLLENAKKAVEMAIEQGEEKAIAWLNGVTP